MNVVNATRIRFGEDSTTLSWGAASEIVLPVGATAIAGTLFRHDPPAPDELEQAIDAIEDALTATGLRQAGRGELLAIEPLLLDLLGLRLAGERCTREAVEAQFQQLASLSLGYPGKLFEPLTAPEEAAKLLILRECMHHLGYEFVVHEGS